MTWESAVLRFALRFDDGVVLENWARVHYGEEPLPRFGDWTYGDLHYHSQGTFGDRETTWDIAPTGTMTKRHDTLSIPLDLSDYSANEMYYLRAFVAVRRPGCTDPGDELLARSVNRYAFINPVWVRPDVALTVAAVL